MNKTPRRQLTFLPWCLISTTVGRSLQLYLEVSHDAVRVWVILSRGERSEGRLGLSSVSRVCLSLTLVRPTSSVSTTATVSTLVLMRLRGTPLFYFLSHTSLDVLRVGLGRVRSVCDTHAVCGESSRASIPFRRIFELSDWPVQKLTRDW